MAKPSPGSTVDTGHALATSLAAAWAFLEGSGATSADSSTNGRTLTFSGAAWGTSGGDNVVTNATAADAAPLVVGSPIVLNGASSWSVACRIKKTTANNSGMICGNSANTNEFVYRNPTAIQFRNVAAGNTTLTNADPAAIRDIVVSYNQPSNLMTLFVDGVQITQVTPTGTANWTINAVMGGYTNDFALVGEMHYLYVYSGRALTLSDAQSLDADPYEFLVPPPGVTLTAPIRVWQRSGSGVAVSLSGGYEDAAANNVQARILLDADDSVVVDWTTVDSSLSGGLWSGTITTPTGGAYYTEVRLRDSGGTTLATDDDTTNTFIVGDVYVALGQSNAVGRGDNIQVYAGTAPAWIVRESGTLDTTLNDPWSVNATGGSWGPCLATLLDAHLGGSVPLCVVVYAVGGSGLVNPANWSGATFAAANVVVTGLGLNGISAVLWQQGESDALNAVAGSAYQSAEVTLANAVAAWPGSPALVSCAIGEQAITPANLDAINAAKIANWDAGETQPGIVFIDFDLPDDQHIKSNVHLATYAGRMLQVLKSHVYSTGVARGPILEYAVSSGSTVTLTFDKNLNTADTSYTTTLFTVSHGGTARTVTAAARSGSRDVVLTLSGPLDGSTPTVTFASGQTAVNATMPRSATVALPVTVNTISEVTLPAEPFYAHAVLADPVVTVTSPISSDRRIVGTAENITWTSDGFSGTVDILISTNNGSSFSSLAAGQTNDGTYSWTPTSGHLGSQVIIRIRSTNDVSISDDSAVFLVATTDGSGGGGGAGMNTAEWSAVREMLSTAGVEVIRL